MTVSEVATVPEVTTPAAASEQPDEQRLQMSYEEFLAWPEEVHAEWVDGEVVVFIPPVDKHQALVGFLHILISLFVNLRSFGIVRMAPFEMRILAGKSSREPDLLFIAKENLERLTPARLEGAADLVIELISDSSVARDRADKFYEYQEAGVREYWIIDPRPGKERVDFYHLLPDGKYQAILPDAAGHYHSHVLPGFWLKVDWLWQAPLPDPLFALADIRGLDPDTAQTLRDILGGQQSSGT